MVYWRTGGDWGRGEVCGRVAISFSLDNDRTDTQYKHVY